MTNLLPSDAQKDTRRFYRARFVLAGSFVFVAGAGLSLLALLPAYILARAEHASFREVAEPSVSGTLDAGFESERTKVLRARALVTQFSSVATSSAPVLEVLVAALELRPRGTLIQDIRYTAGEGRKPGTIVISGSADRARINAYRADLDRDSRFGSVSVPVGAFAGAQAGQFSITLTGAF